ncbi:MAG: DUF4404 family protein [Gammaproteobacteria bacterium]
MDQKRLHQLLAELDRELKSATTLDAESRALLERVVADVPAQVATDTAGRPTDAVMAPEAHLRELMLRFKAEYPKLASTLGQVADALGKLGI